MNTPAPIWAYPILNPHPMTNRPDHLGRYRTLAHDEQFAEGGYLTLSSLRELEEAGFIKIEQVGGNDLAAQYGRVPVLYTIVGVTD